MILENNRLYRNRQDENKVVVVKELNESEVTIIHAPPMNSDICWFVPSKREVLPVEDFSKLYKPFRENL